MNKTKIFIGIPCYNGLITSVTFLSLLNLFKFLDTKNISWELKMVTTDSLVSRARNTISTLFLEKKDFTHLFFIDSDIGFEVTNFERILNYNKDLVCGIYPQKKIHWEIPPLFENEKINPRSLLRYNVNFFDPTNVHIDQEGFANVKEAATGFMLTKRNVFETLINRFPDLKFKARYGSLTYKSELNYDFFKVGNYKEKNGDMTYLSEDFYFSRMWIDCGGEIYADVVSPLRHLGNYTYEGALADAMVKK